MITANLLHSGDPQNPIVAVFGGAGSKARWSAAAVARQGAIVEIAGGIHDLTVVAVETDSRKGYLPRDLREDVRLTIIEAASSGLIKSFERELILLGYSSGANYAAALARSFQVVGLGLYSGDMWRHPRKRQWGLPTEFKGTLPPTRVWAAHNSEYFWGFGDWGRFNAAASGFNYRAAGSKTRLWHGTGGHWVGWNPHATVDCFPFLVTGAELVSVLEETGRSE